MDERRSFAARPRARARLDAYALSWATIHDEATHGSIDRTVGPPHPEVARTADRLADRLAERRAAIDDRQGVIAYRSLALSLREQADDPAPPDVAEGSRAPRA